MLNGCLSKIFVGEQQFIFVFLSICYDNEDTKSHA